MIYQRETNPMILAQLEPHLTVPTHHSKESVLRQALEYMTKVPESIFIFSARDDEGTLLGFIIAQAPPLEDYIWVVQAWSHPKNEWDIADEILHRLVLWTFAINRKRIRAETARVVPTLFRRFGFKEVSKIVSLDVPGDTFERVSYGKSGRRTSSPDGSGSAADTTAPSTAVQSRL